jgi:hypothetical protein
MFLRILSIISFLLLGLGAQAGLENGQPYLFKKITGGHMVPGGEFSIECGIYRNYYKLITVRGGQTFVTAKGFKLGDDMIEKIFQASQGDISYLPAPADVGNSIYGANVKNGRTSVPVDLGSTKDSESISQNSSPQAEELKSFIDQICVD